jgi:uracil-DNA glycosylase
VTSGKDYGAALDSGADSAPLNALRREIAADPGNARAVALGQHPLFAASPASRIAIIGQAPGLKAQKLGKLWADPSGDRLRAWLGVSEGDFYDADKFALLPMDFFFPGKVKSGDLPPRRGFAERWHPRILAELPGLTLTLLIGVYAQRFYLKLPATASLTATVRDYASYLPGRIPLVHPSPLNFRWQAKNPWFETDLVPVVRSSVHAALEP